jgi:hypothetical protein
MNLSDFAARARAKMRALETPNAVGWDAGGDGVVIFTRAELVALREFSAPRALIAAAARGWARCVPPAYRKRRIIDWLIEREAKVWEEIRREMAAESEKEEG